MTIYETIRMYKLKKSCRETIKDWLNTVLSIGRGCSKERVRSAVIKMIEAKFKLELLTQKSFYDVIEEPLKVKIMGEKLKNFVMFSSKKCDKKV